MDSDLHVGSTYVAMHVHAQAYVVGVCQEEPVCSY